MQIHTYTPARCVLSDCLLSDGECIDVSVLPAWLQFLLLQPPSECECCCCQCLSDHHCGAYVIISALLSSPPLLASVCVCVVCV